MTRLLACLAVLLALSDPLAAQTDEPRVVKLAIRPAIAPEIALQHRLLPDVLSQRAGNAAPVYERAGLLVPLKLKMDDTPTKIQNWASMPLGELPREEMRKTLASFSKTIHEAGQAARRRDCDWELPIETEAFNLQIPELQELRHIARALAAKARLEIADGKIESAIETLRTGFAMARHVAQGPTLIHTVLGVAMAELMARQVEELVQQPAAPNLYWALTALPRPFIDIRTAMEYERGTLWVEFPKLRDAEPGPMTSGQLQRLREDLQRCMNVSLGPESTGWWREARLTGMVMRAYPVAKRELVARGRSPREVAAMPALQAVTIYSLQVYRELMDASFKWIYVPYPEARPGIERAAEDLRTAGMRREGFRFASALLPAFQSAYAATARLDRHIAALRCVEACRMYAAGHGEKLPGALDEIREVPIPIDPMTGKPFVYKLVGDRVVLEPPPGESLYHATRYELRITR